MQDFLIMNTLGYPILSLLVFLPLAGVIPLLLLKNDEAAKYSTLFITSCYSCCFPAALFQV